MQRALAIVALAALWGAAEAAAKEHPIAGVITLLEGLQAKVKSEGQAEEVTFAKFESWCKNSVKELEKTITEEKETIESLEDTVESLTKEEEQLTKQIAKLGDEILEHEQADTKATKARSDAAALYSSADQDLQDTITAFQDAIDALDGAKTATSASLAQAKVLALASMPLVLEQATEAQQKVLANPEMPAAMGDLDEHTKKYNFKSNNVIELLKGLKQKFEDDRVEGTKAETASINAYNLAKNARDAALAAATDAKGLKETELGTVQGDLSTAKNDLSNTRGDLEADTTTLEDTEKSCTMKKSEWAERSKIRAGEIKAMEAAIGVLEKASGVRTEAPTNPVLPASPTAAPGAFIALSSSSVDPRQKAVNLLRTEAQKLHSKTFERFAEQVAARVGGPFDDVNNMIQKMIFRLMAEQKDEDDHKNWCDLELEKTNTSKTNKEEKIEELDAKLDDAKATVSLLTTKITEASDMVADLTDFMKEATEVRTTGKEENKAALKDARDAQAALSSAIAIIEEFYKDSGAVPKESWEFVQKGADPVTLPKEPSTWEAGYTGVSDPAAQPDGIITVLKTISADFATMEADTMAQEETDQQAYNEEMKAAEIEKARRAKESEMKGQEKKRLEDKITAMEKSHKHVTGELEAVKQYAKDLEPACVDGDSSYEDRKAARTAEIDALKEAQVILADAFKEKDSLLQKSQGFLAPVKAH